MEALVPLQPILHLLGFVGRVVVDDKVQIERLVYGGVDCLESR